MFFIGKGVEEGLKRVFMPRRRNKTTFKLGQIFTAQRNANVSQALVGRKLSMEHKKHIAEAVKRRYDSGNQKGFFQKGSKVNLGRFHTQATKVKISASKKGRCGLENHPNWQGGKSFEPYPLGWTKTFKEQIRYRDGYKCQICGVPEIECKRKLQVHHIDYCKENLKPENLVSLCNACHTTTNYNRDFWQSVLKRNEH